MAAAFTVRLLLFSSLFLLPISVFAQTNGNIAVGASLTANSGNSSSWLSPSGDFAFGFRQLENSDLFMLSIWYAKLPDRTVVWHANRDDIPKGSTVNLTANSGLVLNSPQGEELWKSETIASTVANGVINDTGNFALKDDKSESLWETFNNPTDTILPGQTIGRGGKLWSRHSETNYSNGRFQLRLQDDGNLVLNSINLPTEFANNPYYDTATTNGTVPGSQGTQLVLNGSGYLYVLRENGGKFPLNLPESVSTRDDYIRATLNFDGIFGQYSHPKNSTGNVGWTRLWSEPDSICQQVLEGSGVGVCGYNSICTLKADNRPICECPRGFSLLDPKEQYGGCKPDFIQGCEEDELTPTKDLYDVEVIPNTDWPTSDYVQLKPFTAEKCNESCFQDCLCAVAIYRSETCWKKKLPLSNGRVDNSLNSQAFIKVRKGNSTLQVTPFPIPDDKKKRRTTLVRAELVLLGTSIFANVILGAALCLGFFFIFRKKNVNVKSTETVLDSNLRSFSYQDLQVATIGFTEELGKGAFGTVYKGVLQIGSGVQVAVKKLNYVIQGIEKEFKTELNVIGKTHHKNLVRLIGYCDEGEQRLLVYELMSNGTLASFLFADNKPSWRQRIDIAMGVARGLLYLHEECSTQIIHCDIKPQNILLDDYYIARISDFGMAKLLMMNQSQTHTAIRGTKGYVAPEWFRNMPITTKVDVYSFGVVLLEIICCRKSVDVENSEEKAILTDWVYDCYVGGVLDDIVDYEVEALADRTNLEKFVMVAIWCIQEDPSLRPTMRKVVQMLEGVVEVHVPPCPSPYTRIG